MFAFVEIKFPVAFLCFGLSFFEKALDILDVRRKFWQDKTFSKEHSVTKLWPSTPPVTGTHAWAGMFSHDNA